MVCVFTFVGLFVFLNQTKNSSGVRAVPPPLDNFPRAGAVSLPSDRESLKTGTISTHHSGSFWGEDRRRALVLTPVLHLTVLNCPSL